MAAVIGGVRVEFERIGGIVAGNTTPGAAGAVDGDQDRIGIDGLTRFEQHVLLPRLHSSGFAAHLVFTDLRRRKCEESVVV